MRRPSFQFYPDDWTGNSKLRRCKAAHKGAWIDVLCMLHDSDEYGIVRCPLAEIAQATGHPVKILQELAERQIIKGADPGQRVDAFIFTPRHAGKEGDPVELIVAQEGPIWYSSRFVRDEYIRSKRGEKTRFGPGGHQQDYPQAGPKPAPKSQPKHGNGDGRHAPKPSPTARKGGGPPAPSPSKKDLDLDLNHPTGNGQEPPSRRTATGQNLLKKFPENQGQDHAETERRRRIGQAMADGKPELAQQIREGTA